MNIDYRTDSDLRTRAKAGDKDAIFEFITKDLKIDEARVNNKGNEYWDSIDGDDLPENIRLLAITTSFDPNPDKAKELLKKADNDPQKYINLQADSYAGMLLENPGHIDSWQRRLDLLADTMGLDTPKIEDSLNRMEAKQERDGLAATEASTASNGYGNSRDNSDDSVGFGESANDWFKGWTPGLRNSKGQWFAKENGDWDFSKMMPLGLFAAAAAFVANYIKNHNPFLGFVLAAATVVLTFMGITRHDQSGPYARRRHGPTEPNAEGGYGELASLDGAEQTTEVGDLKIDRNDLSDDINVASADYNPILPNISTNNNRAVQNEIG